MRITRKRLIAEHTANCEERVQSVPCRKKSTTPTVGSFSRSAFDCQRHELGTGQPVRPMAPIRIQPTALHDATCMDWNPSINAAGATPVLIQVLYDFSSRPAINCRRLVPILELGNRHYHQLEARLAVKMALVLLEDDPLKMQTLRETIQHKIFCAQHGFVSPALLHGRT